MKSTDPTTEKTKSGSRFLLPILVAVPLVLYWQATRFDFVWDDITPHITENPYLVPVTSDNLLHFWKEPYEGLYIPVSYNAWALLDAGFSSKQHDPFPYHLANILLHTLNGLLVFALLRLFIRKPWAAMAGALVFLVHPVQVESVAWVSEFRGLLAAFFGFAALLLHLKGLAGPRWLSWCATACFLLALLSKPSVAILPFFAAALEYHLHRPTLKQLCSRSWLWLWLTFSVAVAVVTASAQSKAPSSPFWAKPFVWMDAVSFYLYKLLVPFSQAASYGRSPEHVMGQWWFYLLWMIPVGAGLCLWRFRKKAPLPVLAALIFLLGFLPVSGLKEFNFQAWSTVADRYLYLSMLGVALGAAYMATRMTRKWQWGIATAVILFLGARTFFVQVPTWENGITLWTHCIEITPGSSKAYGNRGATYLGTKEYGRAMLDLNKAISLDPKNPHSYNNRGIAHVGKQEPDSAISDFNKAISLDPDYENAYNNRGVAYGHKQEFDRAIADFDRALALNPGYAEAYNNRGLAYRHKQDFDRAISDFTRALKANPEYAEAHKNRGLLQGQRREFDRAISDFDAAIAIDPGYAEAYNDRGVAYGHKQEFDRAIADFDKAIDLNPEYAEAWHNRARARFFHRQYRKALDDAEKARDLGASVAPEFLEKLKSLAGR